MLKMEKVNEVPEVSNAKKKLQQFIEEFVNDDAEVVKIHFDETDYKSAKVCCCSLRLAIIRSGHKIKVFKRGEDVYMAK